MKFHVIRTTYHQWDKKPTEYGKIFKDVGLGWNNKEVEIWCIQINTLKDLLEFIHFNNGRAVVQLRGYVLDKKTKKELPLIEIYDGYRE